MKKLSKILWDCLGFLYFFVYALGWLLHKVARFLLAISYYIMLQKRPANDIMESLFKFSKWF